MAMQSAVVPKKPVDRRRRRRIRYLRLVVGFIALIVLAAVHWAYHAVPANNYDPIPDLRAMVLDVHGFPAHTPVSAISPWDRLLQVMYELWPSTPVEGRVSLYGLHSLSLLVYPHDATLDALRSRKVSMEEVDFDALSEMHWTDERSSLESSMRFALSFRDALMDDDRLVQIVDEIRAGDKACVPAINLKNGGIEVPGAMAIRSITYLCAFEMKLALDAGEPDEATIWFERGVALAASSRGFFAAGGALWESSVAVAFLQSVAPLLSHPSLGADNLDQIAQILDRFDDSADRERAVAAYSEIVCRYWASTRFTRAGIVVWQQIPANQDRFAKEAKARDWTENFRGVVMPRRGEVLSELKEMDAEVIHWARLSHLERVASRGQLDPSHRPLSKKIPTSGSLGLNRSYLYARDQIELAIAACRVSICLEKFHLRNGYYPDSLAEIEPQFADELPTNPLQPGEPFIYKRILDQALPVNYLLAARSRYDHGSGMLDKYPFGSDDWWSYNAINVLLPKPPPPWMRHRQAD